MDSHPMINLYVCQEIELLLSERSKHVRLFGSVWSVEGLQSIMLPLNFLDGGRTAIVESDI